MARKRKKRGRDRKQALKRKDAAAKARVAETTERRARALASNRELVVVPTAEGKLKNHEVLHEIAQPLLDELSSDEVVKARLTLLVAMLVWNQMVMLDGRIDDVVESVRDIFGEEMEEPVFVRGVRTMAARKADLFGSDHRIFTNVSVERLPSGELYTHAVAIPRP